jgi:hypothetical protein
MGRDQVTRRAIAKAGGGVALALTAVGAGRAGIARAQEASPASPAASPGAGSLVGRWVTVRSRTLTGDVPADEVLRTIESGYVPLLHEIPGFVAYLGIIDPSSEASAFVTIFDDKAGTDASTAQAGAWLQENNYTFFEGDPVVAEGPIGIATGSLSGGSGDMATPVAGGLNGAYAAIRTRKLKEAAGGQQLLNLVQEGFVSIVEGVTGFIAYIVVANEENFDQIGIGIYADEAGAAESTAQAAEWGAQGAADLTEGDPVVFEGTIGLAEVAG